jgi:hypothetical protein
VQALLCLSRVHPNFVEKVELRGKSANSFLDREFYISVFEQIMACEEFKRSFEVARSKDITNLAADLFKCAAAVHERNHTTLEFRESPPLELDDATP